MQQERDQVESEEEQLERALAESAREEELRQWREQEGKRREQEGLHAVELEELAPLRGTKREREVAQAAPTKEAKMKVPKKLSEVEAGLPPSGGSFGDGGGPTSTMAGGCQQLPSPPDPPASDGGGPPDQSTPPKQTMEGISSAMALSAGGGELRGGQQGLEDCHRRIELINAARKLRGLPVKDYQNNPKAFARDVLRFEIALEGVKFLRSLEYAPPDAALTTAPVPIAIATATPPAVAVSTPTQHLEEQN